MSIRFTCFWLIVFCSTLIATAQSGRKVAAPPPPKIVVEENRDIKDYSESAPSKMPQVYESPHVRKIRNKAKDDDAEKSTPNQTVIQPSIVVEDDTEVLKVKTSLVTIPVSVFDRNGLYIPNLGKSDFKIYEDGKEQEIAYFGTDDKPFTAILLIDTSPSTAYKIEEIQAAAIAFTDQLKPRDSVMVIEFNAGIHILTEPTSDREFTRRYAKPISVTERLCTMRLI